MSSKDYTPPQLTVKPYPPGASGMRSASIANNNNSAIQQNKLNQLAGSKKRRRFKGGGATGSTITVPVVPNPVPETGSGNNTISANVTNSTQIGAAENANSKYDNLVGTKVKTGGKKRSTFKGGRHVHWGCMSGGKSRIKKGSRKSRRKSRRRRR